jgi:arylamine N-acetyltransferase
VQRVSAKSAIQQKKGSATLKQQRMRSRLNNSLISSQLQPREPELSHKLMRNLDVRRTPARTPFLKTGGEQKGDIWKKKKGSRWRA